MRPKLLFFLDFWLTHFGLAKSLMDIFDCESYAIIDVNNKPSRFFKTQNIVNFRKSWYLREVSAIKKPDIQYLKSIEEKFKLNIWKIAFSERSFHSDNYYHKFTYNEILSIIEQECKFYEKILNEVEPDFLLIRIPDWHHLQLLCDMCKAKNIHVLMLVDTKFKGKNMISQDPDKTDEYLKYPKKKFRGIHTEKEIKEYLHAHDKSDYIRLVNRKFYSSKKEKIKAAIEFFFTQGNKEYTNFYINFGRSKPKVLLKESSLRIKWKSRTSFVDKQFIKKIDNNTPFIYYPLHAEPERALLIAAPFYTNQIEVIKNIAKSIPVDYQLYVKEHPSMKKIGYRDISYYKQILDIPNVKLIHPSVPSQKIIKKSSLVVAIKGSSALESIFFGKPSIILADFWGDEFLTSVYKLSNLNELPNVIRTYLNKEVDPTELSMYIDIFEENSFDFDNSILLLEIWGRFYFGGALVDVDILEHKVKQFLKDHKKDFTLLADEHIRKIKEYKL